MKLEIGKLYKLKKEDDFSHASISYQDYNPSTRTIFPKGTIVLVLDIDNHFRETSYMRIIMKFLIDGQIYYIKCAEYSERNENIRSGMLFEEVKVDDEI